jgi:hypothetical protein
MKNWKQKVPSRSSRAAAVGEMVVLRHAGTALPKRLGRTQESVDRRNLFGGREAPGGPYIH